MRRICLILLTMVLVLGLCGCSEIQIEKTQIEKAQDKIVEIGEQFLEYELTVEEAKEKLDSISIPETEGNGKIYLTADKNYLVFLILKTKTNNATFEEIQDIVDEIKNSDYEE